MGKPERSLSKNRVRTSAVTTVISISLVLFMLGLLAIVLINARNISNHVKENIGFSIILKPGVKPIESLQIQKQLDAKPFVKSTEFVHQDSAAVQLERELGEEFVDFLGYNPLLASIDVKLEAQYAHPDSLKKIEADLMELPQVKEVFYQKDLVDKVNENIEKISLIILGISTLFLIIAIALINNTIRLSIYSQRFIIKTMQLVGAKTSFILKPFITKSIINGLLSAIIANGLLIALIYYIQKEAPDIIDLKNITMYGTIFILVVLIGIIISWFSTARAVRKFLRKTTDYLYI